MKISGKLVTSVILSMLFVALILFTYVFVYISRLSFENSKNVQNISAIFRDMLTLHEDGIRSLIEKGETDELFSDLLGKIFPDGWAAVLENERIIRSEKSFPAEESEIFSLFGKKDFSGTRVFKLQGGRTCLGFAWEEGRVIILGILPTDTSFMKSTRNFLAGLALIFLAGIAGVSFIVYLTCSKFVIRPMMRISEAAYRISTGDYSRSVKAKETFDESQKLAEAVDDMMRQLKEYHDDVETKMRKAYEESARHQKNLIIAQRLAATGKLAAGIAHEINNPLGGMLNAVDVLKKGFSSGSKKERDYILLVEDGLKRIRMTVEKILQFHQTERFTAPVPVNMKVAIEKAISFVHHRLAQKNIHLKVPPLDDMPSVLGNEMEIQQIFLNILMNAIDAVKRSGIMEISWRTDEKKVRVEIRDNGHGMERNELAQIFDMFYTTKEAGEGTGLGLFIVYNLVKNHGGDIEIESEKGKGTKVRLIFPAVESSQ